jgi:hypothetical protein
VRNSTIQGGLYCQASGSTGNNKACNTSRLDPVPQPFPISDGNIEQWKADAAAGGTVTCSGGNYIPASGATLGPKKIPCNLVITNDFKLGGAVWVTGNITTTNGNIVSLNSAAFGSSGTVIVVDGTISISNNSQFNGTGQTGSYIMLLSTNTGSSAIQVSNNAGAVILNAQKGTIHFYNGSSAKEATANSIDMDNNSELFYESGLINTNFVSGPGGTYVPSSWQEIQ